MRELIDKFLIKNSKKLQFTGNVYTYNQNIDRNILNRLVDKYNIAFEEEVLTINDNYLAIFIDEIFEDNSSSWTRMDRNHYLSSIINENYLISLYSEETQGSNKRPDNLKIIQWDEIDEIKLFEDDDEDLFFRFFISNSTDTVDIYSERFATQSLKTCRELLKLFDSIKDADSSQIKSSYQEQVDNLIGQEKYQEALNLTNDLILEEENHTEYSRDYVLASVHKPKLLFLTDKLNESLKAVNDLIQLCDELKEEESVNEVYVLAYELKSEICYKMQQFDLAIKNIGFCERLIEENNFEGISKGEIREIKEAKTKYYNALINEFSKVSADNRKQVFISNEIHPSENFLTLKKQNLPLDISFPFGHPHINNIYTCHPLKNNHYIPLAKIKQELFKDRVSEFCYLMQCLGATKIEISTSNNKTIENNSKSSLKVDANIDYKVTRAKVDYQMDKEEENKQIELLGIKKVQTFKPTNKPYIPEDLIWYNSETSWQRLANQRINGNIAVHTENIVSMFNEVVSNNEINKINAELKFLLPKIGVDYNKENEIKTNSKETLEWGVFVQFQDKELLEQKKTIEIPEINNKIEKYKEEVAFMIEDDGLIDDGERRMLERKQKKYGLTKEQAEAVEQELLFNPNEIKYIEEYKLMLEEGSITETERKMLTRYAKRYDIDETRQQELEDSLN
ncbi:hypothetical protein [Mangrovimonas cancribranchiae]|uniref:Uncharacterized protein n=1 Tax=Mangrovimonas cancribranchiae TaxID=3080055 RepID=A0AAU6P9A9_9FLAO